MKLDMTTVFVLLVTGHLVTVILITAYRRGQSRDKAVNAFFAAKWLQAIGWGLSVFRGSLSDWITIFAANSALFLGGAFEAAALLRVVGTLNRTMLRFYILLTSLCIFLFHLMFVLGGSERDRIAAASIGMAVLLFVPAVQLMNKPGGSMLMKVSGGLYLVIAGGAIIRAALAWGTEASLTLFEPSLYQTLTFLSLFLLMFMGNTGFVLLSKEQADRELTKLASYDDLTGARNRRTFMVDARHAIVACERSNQPVSLMLMDIDYFKNINDTYGHDKGDQVLQEYAAALRSVLRPSDLLGRYGGDEFAVLLPEADERRSDTMAEAIMAAIARSGKAEGAFSFTVSIGIVTVHPGRQLPLERLYKLSDDALYRAKQKGRNQAARSEVFGELIVS